MARGKKTASGWSDVKAALQSYDRTGLLGLVRDMYATNKDNQSFLHARLGLGPNQLKPYKDIISRWVNPDFMRNQPVSVSKAKKAISDYKKAIGRPDGLAELSIFYCEEAFAFVESCGLEDEGYFLALIRMYQQATTCVSDLPNDGRGNFIERLDQLRSRATDIGWGVHEELNDIWYEAGLDDHHS